MSRSQSLTTAVRAPEVSLAAFGWLATGLVLASSDPVIAIGTLFVGLPLWIFDVRIGAVAMTQVGVAVAAPSAPLALIALLETGPAFLLLAVLAEQGLSVRTVGVMTISTALLGGVAIAGFLWGGSLFAATGVLLLVGALSSYAIHRYEIVALGLVDGENA